MEKILLHLIDYFPDLLDVSFTASIVILFVLCVRQFLKRAPKIFSYALWGIVLLRLLVPISIESPVSFVPEKTEFTSMVEVNAVLPEIQFETPQDRAENQLRRENTPPGQPFTQVSRSLDAQTYLTLCWLLGMTVMLARGTISYLKLRRRLKVVVPYRKGICIADDIDTPFVMGFFRPVIYLPGTLDGKERKYIIAHEQHHIHRADHIFKALGYLALTIHWFNPFVWVAFSLANRDMEMSCDEAVIRKLGEDVRADYSVTLLNLAAGHRLFTGTPLAFGECDPAGRVRNLAKWKKPAFWVILVCVMICLVLAVCLLTNPMQQQNLEDTTMMIGPASVEIGELEFTLPQGFTIAMRESQVQPEGDMFLHEHVIGKDDIIVGGVYKLKSSDATLHGTWDWAESLHIPENVPHERLMMSVQYTEHLADVPYCMAVFYGKSDVVETIHYLFDADELVYDLWFDMKILTEEEKNEILETAELPAFEESDISDNWGVSLVPDRVSRTGATALFRYSGSIPGEEGAELTYGDFLSLDRLVDGSWIACDELAGYDYFVGDASYPVVDGYGMVHEWPKRFGELADGHYRLGKQVTLIRQDGSSESRMVYGEFSIPDSILTGPIPLEDLPEIYGTEQAMLDGCLVCPNGIARDNMDQFRSFADACNRGEPGFFRVMYYYYGDNPYYLAYDIHFDGSKYTVNSMESGDGRISVFEFPYLKHFTGPKEREEYPYDAYEYYCFVGDANITWQEIFDGQYEGKYMPIFLNHIYYPKSPQLPASPAEATLEFEGEALVKTTDFDRLEKIWILFQDGEFLGYEPKTHSIGHGLNLVLKSQNGESMTIELDPDSDICRINGEFVFYGAVDEPEYIEKLWYYLDIEAWPDVVYENYPNAFRG